MPTCNHLSTERLRCASANRFLFVWHGYTDLWIDRWVKATPAFNLSLLRTLRPAAAGFRRPRGSIHHPFDKAGNRHMELRQPARRSDDMPLDRIVADFRIRYPLWLRSAAEMNGASFDADVAEGDAALSTHSTAPRSWEDRRPRPETSDADQLRGLPDGRKLADIAVEEIDRFILQPGCFVWVAPA